MRLFLWIQSWIEAEKVKPNLRFFVSAFRFGIILFLTFIIFITVLALLVILGELIVRAFNARLY